MSERSPIPGLPPLSAIQDPAVRSFLTALVQAWNVRNGVPGADEHRFVTKQELDAALAKKK